MLRALYVLIRTANNAPATPSLHSTSSPIRVICESCPANDKAQNMTLLKAWICARARPTEQMKRPTRCLDAHRIFKINHNLRLVVGRTVPVPRIVRSFSCSVRKFDAWALLTVLMNVLYKIEENIAWFNELLGQTSTHGIDIAVGERPPVTGG